MSPLPKRYCKKCDDYYYNLEDILSIEVRGMCMFCARNKNKKIAHSHVPMRAIKDKESMFLEDFHKGHEDNLTED